jgi:hypothetical protein
LSGDAIYPEGGEKVIRIRRALGPAGWATPTQKSMTILNLEAIGLE